MKGSSIVKALIGIEFCLCLFYIQYQSKCERIAADAKRRKPKNRFDWDSFRNSLTDHQFRRMFRMSKEDFDVLCNMIIDAVGVEEFKPEWFIYRERLAEHVVESINANETYT